MNKAGANVIEGNNFNNDKMWPGIYGEAITYKQVKQLLFAGL